MNGQYKPTTVTRGGQRGDEVARPRVTVLRNGSRAACRAYSRVHETNHRAQHPHVPPWEIRDRATAASIRRPPAKVVPGAACRRNRESHGARAFEIPPTITVAIATPPFERIRDESRPLAGRERTPVSFSRTRAK